METINQIELLLYAVIGEKIITMKDLYNMNNGYIINLDSKITDMVCLYVNNLLIATGILVDDEGSIGIKIKEIVVKSEKK